MGRVSPEQVSRGMPLTDTSFGNVAIRYHVDRLATLRLPWKVLSPLMEHAAR